MNTAFFIALRYLFSHKKQNIINIISIISVVGIMASTAALVIVLSVFNGMQDLVVSNFNRFNPPLKIEAKEGKVFSLENAQFSISDLEEIAEVKAVEQVVNDLVLVTYQDKQTLATLYGVSENYPELSQLEETILDGNFYIYLTNSAVFGAGVAGVLGIDIQDFTPAKLYYPKRHKKNLANPMDAFQMHLARPVGVFASYTHYDENALFVPVSLAKELFDYNTEISFLSVYLNENYSPEKVQKKITKIVGDDFSVSTQMQQEALLFKTIQAENLMVYIILGFIFLIATFNISGILGMLILEKKQDIYILNTLGGTKTLIKRIFLVTGTMIGIFGGLLGMFIGWICCILQQQFGIIKLGSAESSYIIPAYPVSIEVKDFVAVFLLIVCITFITSWLSLRGLKRNYLINKY